MNYTIVGIFIFAALTIGFIIVYSENMAVLLRALKTGRIMKKLLDGVEERDTKITILSEQNDILRSENSRITVEFTELRKQYERLSAEYEDIKLKYRTIGKLLDKNIKNNKEIQKELTNVSNAFDEFREGIGHFLIEGMGADPEKVRKLLRQK